MIIGGAFQGKAAFAEKKYPEIEWVNGADADWNSIQNAKGVVNFHEFIRAEMKKNEDVSDLAEKLIQCNPGVLLVSDEVGYGVVPMHLTAPTERLLAESVQNLLRTVMK